MPFSEWPFGVPQSAAPGQQPATKTPLDSLGDPLIDISGLPTFSDIIIWPFGSGQQVGGNLGFSKDVDALLTGVNAQFGFNQQPHRFTLSWAQRCFDDDEVPNVVGDPVDFIIGTFRIRGRVTHVDVNKSSKGRFLQTSIEDVRSDLNKVIVDTYGLFDENQDARTISNNVIDIHHFHLVNGLERDPRGLRLLREHGVTWAQFHEAIVGIGGNIFESLPDSRFVTDRLTEEKQDSYRWSFRTTPLLDALVKIFSDLSYDLYWSMDEGKLKVIDRTKRITVDETKIPGVEVGQNVTTLKKGVDEGERPTSVQIFGGRMEGIIGGGGGTVSITGGVTPTATSVQLDIQEDYEFRPAWQGAQVFYFGPDGTQLADVPTDEELAAALKGIEWWAQKKANVTSADQAIASRIDDNIIYPRTGAVFPNLAGHSASGIGLIPNRGTTEDKWVIEWYNRIRNFAQNHYTRSYFLSSSSALFKELDRFEVVDEAWCGLENEIEGGDSYNTGYRIAGRYRWLAPFWNEDTNKLSAWMFIPGIPLWGIDGKGVPTQFENWNEDSDRGVYIPIEVEQWNRASNRLESDGALLEPQRSDRGLIIRLPNICFKEFTEDTDVSKLKIPQYLRGKFQAETTQDMTIDPTTLGRHFESFSTGINIPVQVWERYGSQKPVQFSAGGGAVDFSRAEVQQRDDLVPWSFQPRGTKTTVQLLQEEGQGIATGRVVNRGTVDFIEVSVHGLPLITFDQYADEEGCAEHGITNLALQKNATGFWATKYSAKTHFPQPIKAKPVQEEVLEDFRFVLHRVNERFNRPPKPIPFQPPPIFDPKTEDGNEFTQFPRREQFEILVEITDLKNVDIGGGSIDIAYAGTDENGVKWPAAFRANENGTLNPDSRLAQFQNAFAIDGFFQKGMTATYHYQELENGDIVHWFTGGVAISEARIVQALDSPALVNGIFRLDVQTPEDTFQRQVPGSDPPEFQTVTLEEIKIQNVRFTDNDNVDTTIKAGDFLLTSGFGNENGNAIKPSFANDEYTVDVGESGPTNHEDKIMIISGGRGGASVQFATVTEKPNNSTGRGGKIQTISVTEGGTLFEDQKIVGAGEGNPGTQYFVDFVGIEFNQISLGDPCIVVQEVEPPPDDPDVAESTPVKIRLLTYINKPLFMATDSFGNAT